MSRPVDKMPQRPGSNWLMKRTAEAAGTPTRTSPGVIRVHHGKRKPALPIRKARAGAAGQLTLRSPEWKNEKNVLAQKMGAIGTPHSDPWCRRHKGEAGLPSCCHSGCHRGGRCQQPRRRDGACRCWAGHCSCFCLHCCPGPFRSFPDFNISFLSYTASTPLPPLTITSYKKEKIGSTFASE